MIYYFSHLQSCVSRSSASEITIIQIEALVWQHPNKSIFFFWFFGVNVAPGVLVSYYHPIFITFVLFPFQRKRADYLCGLGLSSNFQLLTIPIALILLHTVTIFFLFLNCQIRKEYLHAVLDVLTCRSSGQCSNFLMCDFFLLVSVCMMLPIPESP